MSGDDYLSDYKRSNAIDLTGGLGGYVRRRLDSKAIASGQGDRHALFVPRVLRLANIELETPTTVLELGCGSGWAISYRHPSLRYIAVDRGSIYRSALEARGVEFHEADVAKDALPLRDGSVDLIILNHIIEHIAESEFLVRELRRVMRPKGMIYIRTPNLKRVKWAFWDDYTHVKPFTVQGLDHLMRSVGFARRFMFHSDHPRIMVDTMTGGWLSGLLFNNVLGGKEIEAGYSLDSHD